MRLNSVLSRYTTPRINFIDENNTRASRTWHIDMDNIKELIADYLISENPGCDLRIGFNQDTQCFDITEEWDWDIE